MVTETLCTEISLDQGQTTQEKHTGQIQTWEEHHCRWLDNGAAEGKVEGSTGQATAARCD
eukprot:6745370-Prorocentrum_lima.AAC.1